MFYPLYLNKIREDEKILNKIKNHLFAFMSKVVLNKFQRKKEGVGLHSKNYESFQIQRTRVFSKNYESFQIQRTRVFCKNYESFQIQRTRVFSKN